MAKHVPAQASRLSTCSSNCLRNAFLFTKKTYRILRGCGNSLKFDICATVTIFTATEGFTPSKQGQVAWAASETSKADAYRVKICEHIALQHLSLGHAHGKTVSGDTKAFKFWNGSPPMLKPLFFHPILCRLWSLIPIWMSVNLHDILIFSPEQPPPPCKRGFLGISCEDLRPKTGSFRKNHHLKIIKQHTLCVLYIYIIILNLFIYLSI